MEKLNINSTYTTPQVIYDPAKGMFEIEGRVIPEDAESFFSEIFNWIDKYVPGQEKPLIVRFRLFYYNTSSSKRLFDIMRKFDELYQKGGDIKIMWEYEDGDDDAMLDGEDYKRYLKIPFDIVKIG
jgi:hypothetical protein